MGIVQANQRIDAYKYMVLNNLLGLVDWKVRRDAKNLPFKMPRSLKGRYATSKQLQRSGEALAR